MVTQLQNNLVNKNFMKYFIPLTFLLLSITALNAQYVPYATAKNKGLQYEKEEKYYDAILQYNVALIAKDKSPEGDGFISERMDICVKKLKLQQEDLKKALAAAVLAKIKTEKLAEFFMPDF